MTTTLVRTMAPRKGAPAKIGGSSHNRLAIEWIGGLLDEFQISGSELARRSGVVPSTILRMLNDENHRFTPALKTLQKVSQATNRPIPHEVLQGFGSVAMPRSGTLQARPDSVDTEIEQKGEVVVASRPSASSTRQRVAVEDATLEVRHVSYLPKTLHPGLNTAARVDRPPQLVGDTTAFAFYMPNNDLAPFVKAATLMYATQRRDPTPGDLVLITAEDGRSKVRSLKDISSEGLIVEKPGAAFDAEDETVAFDEIGSLHVVAGIWKL